MMTARPCAGLIVGALLMAGCAEMAPPEAAPPVSTAEADEALPADTAPPAAKAAAAPVVVAKREVPPEVAAWYAARPDGERTIPGIDAADFHPMLLRNQVEYQTDQPPGTVVIDTKGPFLYLVEGDGRATRYGIAIGREGFGWTGTGTIARRARWPGWTPPPEMIKRDPSLEKWRNGQPGGVNNPLGARALYINFGSSDSGYRIHGTNTPKSIGRAASSGCFRMLNHDVVDLYDRVATGAKVIVM